MGDRACQGLTSCRCRITEKLAVLRRPEAIDSALRRPGRFDREVYFGLPSLDDRSAILTVHTRRSASHIALHSVRLI